MLASCKRHCVFKHCVVWCDEVRHGAQEHRQGGLAPAWIQGSVPEAGVRRGHRYAVTPLHA